MFVVELHLLIAPTMKITAILKGKIDKQDKQKIYIRFSDRGKQSFKATKIKIERKFWDLETEQVKPSCPDHKFFNRALKLALSEAEVFAQSPDFHKQDKANETNLDFFYQFDNYIESKENKVTPGMMKVFKNVKGVLMEFERHRSKKIEFGQIDFNFYEELVDYCLFNHVHRRTKEQIVGMKLSNAGKIIKQLRIFLNNRIRKKIIEAIDLKDFKILDEEADAIYLNEKEIKQIFEADLSREPHLDKYRYLLVFGCQTGMRWSDFSTINPKNDLRGQRLYKKQGKSDSWVVVPLRDLAYMILTDIFKKRIPEITNPDFNYYIKEVGKRAGITQPITFSYKKGNKDIVETKPKFEWITSHTCRRSFCTNEFLAGTPVELIMKISGHKSLRDFYKYIRVTQEQAANQIERIWKERAEVA